MKRDHDSLLRDASLLAGSLLLVLVVATYGSGASQQHLEWASAPAGYARYLVAHATALRIIAAIDDVFIAAYVVAGIEFARRLARDSSPVLRRSRSPRASPRACSISRRTTTCSRCSSSPRPGSRCRSRRSSAAPIAAS